MDCTRSPGRPAWLWPPAGVAAWAYSTFSDLFPPSSPAEAQPWPHVHCLPACMPEMMSFPGLGYSLHSASCPSSSTSSEVCKAPTAGEYVFVLFRWSLLLLFCVVSYCLPLHNPCGTVGLKSPGHVLSTCFLLCGAHLTVTSPYTKLGDYCK